MSTKIPQDFEGSIHVRTNDGFVVLVAGDEIPTDALDQVDTSIFKREQAEAPKVVQDDAKPVEDVLAEANEAPRPRAKRS